MENFIFCAVFFTIDQHVDFIQEVYRDDSLNQFL